MTLGEEIRQARENKNLSQEDLAEQLGVSRQAISKWENNTSVPQGINREMLSKLLELEMLKPDDSSDKKQNVVKWLGWATAAVLFFLLCVSVWFNLRPQPQERLQVLSDTENRESPVSMGTDEGVFFTSDEVVEEYEYTRHSYFMDEDGDITRIEYSSDDYSPDEVDECISSVDYSPEEKNDYYDHHFSVNDLISPRMTSVQFYDSNLNIVNDVALWYNSAEIDCILVQWSGGTPDNIKIFWTPSGSETMEQMELLLTKSVLDGDMAALLNADVLKEIAQGHVYFQLDFGEVTVKSDIYNFFYDLDFQETT